MSKLPLNLPAPPPTSPRTRILMRDSPLLCYIWLQNPALRATIETQYVNADRIRALKGCARSTAYRIIKRFTKRYWLIDMTDPEAPSCCAVLPVELLKDVEIKPVGNPNFRSGIYQQSIALKRHRVATRRR